MAAHSFLQIGGLWIFAYREWYSEALASVFRDDENVSTTEAPVFCLSAGHLQSRLNVMGFTSASAANALDRTFAATAGAGGDEGPPFDE